MLSVLAPQVNPGSQPETPLQPVGERLSLAANRHIHRSAAAQCAVELQDLRHDFLRQGPVHRRSVTFPLNE